MKIKNNASHQFKLKPTFDNAVSSIHNAYNIVIYSL